MSEIVDTPDEVAFASTYVNEPGAPAPKPSAAEPSRWTGPSQEEWEATLAELGHLSGLVEQAEQAEAWAQAQEAYEAAFDPFEDGFQENLAGHLSARDEALIQHVQETLQGPLQAFEDAQLRGEVSDIIGSVEGSEGLDHEIVLAVADEAVRQFVEANPAANFDPQWLASAALQDATQWLIGQRDDSQAQTEAADEVALAELILSDGRSRRARPRSPEVGNASDEVALARAMFGGAPR